MYNELQPFRTFERDERIIGRSFGFRRPWGFSRPWGYGFGRPFGFGLSPFLGGLAGGLLGSALFAPYGYGYGFPGYGYGYPYFW